MQVVSGLWLRWMTAAILAGVCLGAPRVSVAQRQATPLFQRPLAASTRHRVPSDVQPLPYALAPDSVERERAVPVFDPRPRARGPIALRGLLAGAVVGGIMGYVQHRHEEYGGAIGGPILGAVIGAPIGMLVFLLATPL